jgi:hypothetical protein
MMRILTQNDKQIEIMGRLVQPWLEKMILNPLVFWDLTYHDKVLLYKMVCVGGQHPSDLQLRHLCKALRSAEGRIDDDHYDPVDHLTNEQLMASLSIETSDEHRNYLKKF